jgi:hypothetical protein
MEHSNRWKAAALPLVAAVALILGLSACTQGEALGAGEEEVTSEATVEPVEGTELSKVTLTQRAAERLGIQTAQVRDAQVAAGKGKGAAGKVIPYSAVLYDEQGDTWTFTSPQPLTYVRQKITLDHIQGDKALLVDGPPAGTTVVTVGAPELLGAELGVGE